MKSVLISIKPKWCEKIASGEKTIEIRKTRPKLDTPFTCYIYCTAPRRFYMISKHLGTSDEYLHLYDGKITMSDGFELFGKEDYMILNRRVIGQFVCDDILPINIYYSDPNSHVALKEFPNTCLTDKEIIDYLGNGKYVS